MSTKIVETDELNLVIHKQAQSAHIFKLHNFVRKIKENYFQACKLDIGYWLLIHKRLGYEDFIKNYSKLLAYPANVGVTS